MNMTRDAWRTSLANSWTRLKLGAMEAIQNVRRDPTRLLPVLVIALMMWFWLGTRAGILWGTYVLFLVYDWNNRVIVGVAMAALLVCFGLSIAQVPDVAELVAEWVYLLLWMVLALQFIELKRHPERFLD